MPDLKSAPFLSKGEAFYRKEQVSVGKRISKFLKKIRTRGFTIMVVPNSEGNIRSIRIPFFVVVLIIAFILLNITLFVCYPMQIAKLYKKDMIIWHKQKIIARQSRDLKQIEPAIKKTEKMVNEMNEQKRLALETREYLRFVRKKVNRRGSVSRGSRPSLLIPPSIKESKRNLTELDLLNENLEYVNAQKSVVQNELKTLLQDLKRYNFEYDHTPSIWPANGRITSGFGTRVHPITRSVKRHTGIDIKVRTGTSVKAAADGVVEFAGYRRGYGWTVIINHGYGYKTLYAHNSSLIVKGGEKVKKGMHISYSGNSGTSTGPHLHFEVIVDKAQVNPISFLGR